MNNNQNHVDNKPSPKLKCKIFEERKSLITELLETKHFTAVKCLFYSILFGFIAKDIVCGLVFSRKVDYGLILIRIAFAKFDLVMLMWCAMFCVNILTFYLFKLWANVRIALVPKSHTLNLWDYVFLLGILLYYFGVLIITPIFTKVFDVGVASSCAIVVEALRIVMKTHSFVRTNVPEVKNYKLHSEQEYPLANLKNYLYFFFVPTLIYRKEYPRTNDVNKMYAFQCFVEVLAVMWLQSFVMNAFFVRHFEGTDVRRTDWANIIGLIMQNVFGGFIMMISVFYQLLDRWLNGWSELLRFADRRFYEDWWTSTNYSIYLRNWNIVVQDWLFEFVYKEFYENILPYNRRIAKLMVFFVSAIFHEYVLIFMLDVFFPVLFFNFFVIAQLLTNYYINSKHPFFNMGMLYSLALGNTIQIYLYTMELYARKHCLDNSPWSYFKPRIFTADCVL